MWHPAACAPQVWGVGDVGVVCGRRSREPAGLAASRLGARARTLRLTLFLLSPERPDGAMQKILIRTRTTRNKDKHRKVSHRVHVRDDQLATGTHWRYGERHGRVCFTI